MKKWRIGALLLSLAGLSVMAAQHLIAPLPDWAVRSAGAAMLIALPVLVFVSLRGRGGSQK